MNDGSAPTSGRNESEPVLLQPVLLLGDTATTDGMHAPLTVTARTHSLVIADEVTFDVGAMNDLSCVTDHPAVVAALRQCLTLGVDLWLPYLGDIGNPRAVVGLLGAAASLGIVVLVDANHPVPWQSVVLPGLSAAQIVCAVAVSTQRFLAAAGADLMVTALLDAVRHDAA